MILATPSTADIATMATPSSSPIIIHMVRRTPILMPNVIASVMHIPGVILTKKKVGMNMDNNVKSTNCLPYFYEVNRN